MNDIRKLKDQQRENHPGIDNYLECMTRAFFAGLSGFTLGLCFASMTSSFSDCYNIDEFSQASRVFTSPKNCCKGAFRIRSSITFSFRRSLGLSRLIKWHQTGRNRVSPAGLQQKINTHHSPTNNHASYTHNRCSPLPDVPACSCTYIVTSNNH